MKAMQRVGGAVLLAATVVLVMAGAAGAGATSAPAVKGVGALDCGASGKVEIHTRSQQHAGNDGGQAQGHARWV